MSDDDDMRYGRNGVMLTGLSCHEQLSEKAWDPLYHTTIRESQMVLRESIKLQNHPLSRI